MEVYGPVRHPKNIMWNEASAILHFLSKIIMQIPFRNRIENDAVQSRSI